MPRFMKRHDTITATDEGSAGIRTKSDIFRPKLSFQLIKVLAPHPRRLNIQSATTVVLANKHARTVWALLAHDRAYQSHHQNNAA